MENRIEKKANITEYQFLEKGDMETKDFSDDFKCFVCFDIVYKPVVLACGHVSCFGCIVKAMEKQKHPHCPVCRSEFSHFPRICECLHVFLSKVYPSPYKRREKQFAEEGKEKGHASPQFEDKLLNSQSNEVVDKQATSPLPEAVPFNSNCKDVRMTDLLCAVCNQLFCRPLVLNCGHVYCEACVNNPDSRVCKCPFCPFPHPNEFPKVFLGLVNFLEEHFPEKYSARKEPLASIQSGIPSGSSIEKQEQTACSSGPAIVSSSSSSSSRSAHQQKHHGVGCDYCGMFPIIGIRYKCRDCVGEIGFDLCEECHNMTSLHPGRFNQHHTQDHQFMAVY